MKPNPRHDRSRVADTAGALPNNTLESGSGKDPGSLLSSSVVSNGSKDGTARLLMGCLNSLGKIVELRDLYTASHQRRVTRLARAIARQLSLPEDQIIAITVAGLLHDIGKICVPTAILNKSGQLTDAEFFMVKSHPEFGYDIVKDIEFEWPIADIILQHHERLDGSGYPHGLTGDQIRFETQVLSVADVVEAMAAHRPYRPSLGIEQAMSEILDKSGTEFNPEVVSACIRVCHDSAVHPGKDQEKWSNSKEGSK